MLFIFFQQVQQDQPALELGQLESGLTARGLRARPPGASPRAAAGPKGRGLPIHVVREEQTSSCRHGGSHIRIRGQRVQAKTLFVHLRSIFFSKAAIYNQGFLFLAFENLHQVSDHSIWHVCHSDLGICLNLMEKQIFVLPLITI